VQECEEPRRIGNLGRGLSLDSLQGARDLRIRPPLEHRRRDEETEQRPAVSFSHGTALDSARADMRWTTEHIAHTGVRRPPEVRLQGAAYYFLPDRH